AVLRLVPVMVCGARGAPTLMATPSNYSFSIKADTIHTAQGWHRVSRAHLWASCGLSHTHIHTHIHTQTHTHTHTQIYCISTHTSAMVVILFAASLLVH